MRKTIKTAAVVAAMSALTIASASVAFAAVDERTNLTSLGKDAAGDAAAVGEWKGNDVDGWTFTVDGEKLSGMWAQIDGAWYYFHKDAIMAQDELVYLEGETYYFHPDGRMQADGWLKLKGDGDQIYEYGLDIEEYKDDIINKVDGQSYSNVWLYFNADGTAVDDEWFTDPASDLHYYFDDIIMVAGDYDHLVGTTTYGFGTDGHMFVGWEQNYDDLMKTAPNKDAETWYYYNKNGKKFVASEGDGFAWKEIDGNWYCFKAEDPSVGTLIVNSYFKNTNVATGDDKYYYVDKKGAMQTGVTNVPKDAYYVTGAWDDGAKTGEAAEVLLGSKGPAEANKWSGNSFYWEPGKNNVFTFEGNKKMAQATYNAKTKHIYASLVKSAYIWKDDTMYLVDKYGDKVVNTATLVGYVDVATNGSVTFVEGGQKDETLGRYNAYVISNAKGEIALDTEVEDRTAKAGAKKYTPVADGAATYTVGGQDLQLYYYENEN